MSKFLHDTDNGNNAAKVIAMPRVFSKNSWAKTAGYHHFLLLLQFNKKIFSWVVKILDSLVNKKTSTIWYIDNFRPVETERICNNKSWLKLREKTCWEKEKKLTASG